MVVTTPHSASFRARFEMLGTAAGDGHVAARHAPASSSVPVTMRSGMISYSPPCSSSTPSTTSCRRLTRNPCAHRVEKVGEIDDLGSIATFLNVVVPSRKHRREHRVLRRADAGHAKFDGRALQTRVADSRDEVTVSAAHFASERDERLLVHSVARVPSTQPPGSGTSARPNRPSSAPTMSNEAASFRTSA